MNTALIGGLTTILQILLLLVAGVIAVVDLLSPEGRRRLPWAILAIVAALLLPHVWH